MIDSVHGYFSRKGRQRPSDESSALSSLYTRQHCIKKQAMPGVFADCLLN
jgi:hypothetical protein